MGKIEGGLGRGASTSVYDYDFGADGGAIGAITMRAESGKLPDDAVIVGATLEALTTPTSAGAATIALGYTGQAAAILAATAYTNAGFIADAVTKPAAAIPAKVSAAAGVNLLVTVAGAALTAGAFRLHIDWIPGTATT